MNTNHYIQPTRPSLPRPPLPKHQSPTKAETGGDADLAPLLFEDDDKILLGLLDEDGDGDEDDAMWDALGGACVPSLPFCSCLPVCVDGCCVCASLHVGGCVGMDL
jgi:hypothetical protein